MNIWLKTENLRQTKLRQSLVNSSAASIRTPLPVILENERQDDLISNSNISIKQSTDSELQINRRHQSLMVQNGHYDPFRSNLMRRGKEFGSKERNFPLKERNSLFNSSVSSSVSNESDSHRGKSSNSSKSLSRFNLSKNKIYSSSLQKGFMEKSKDNRSQSHQHKNQPPAPVKEPSNHLQSRWKSSVNSFSSLRFQNSSENRNQSNPLSSSNENNRKVQESKKNYSHTNSKRLLTTGRHHDRRQYIISIIEYCSNEVGMACYNVNTGEIKLAQIIQRMTYIKTISTLERFYPQEIIFSSTLEQTLLMRKLMKLFRRTSFKPVKRGLFDETKGYYIYTLRGNKNENNPDHKFLSYAALHALLVTMENTFQFTLTYSALNIKWHYLQEVLVIDSQTIADLQIFINKETKIIKNTFIDNFKCLTDGGMRMLRANILQPLTERDSISERLNLVETLLKTENKGVFDMLAKELIKFKNYEPITAKFIQSPKCQNIKSIKSYLNGILLLSRMCFELQNLDKKIGSFIESGVFSFGEKSQNAIIKVLHSKLKDQRLEDIRKVIEENFDPEVLKNYQSNNSFQDLNMNKGNKNKNNRSQRGVNQKNKRDNFIFLFKLQKISDEFAQISRLTYSHTIEDILKIFEQIKNKFPPQNSLKLLYNEYRGYFISARTTQAQPIDLSHTSNLIQDDIVFIGSKGNTTTFSTSMLISLNNRLKENEHKLIYQSTQLLLSIIKDIQRNMEVLFQVNYWISMLDMAMAFVGFVRVYQGNHNVIFSRPQFITQGVEGNTVKIEKLRSIWTMEKLQRLSSDITLSLQKGVSALAIHKELNSFDQLNILYSIGFLTILAQIGCLVPAELYCTYIYDTLISKMEVEGNLENKMSHFQTELYSLKNILDNAIEYDEKGETRERSQKGKCLILIDEICKGTKPEQEYAISMATMEDLIEIRSNGQRNVAIVLVSDRKLFNMLGKFERVALCEFSGTTDQENEKNEDEILRNKQKQLLQCLKKYNFGSNFEQIYRKMPRI